MSPQNVLLGLDGVVRVVDFGIAKAAWASSTTQEGQFDGKLGYFAPEQLELRPIDRRTDIFTAGIVLWEMHWTGRWARHPPSPAIEWLASRTPCGSLAKVHLSAGSPFSSITVSLRLIPSTMRIPD